MPLDQDLKLTLASIGGALESIGVTWAIGGSFASTIHGEPRSTNDIDVVARLAARDARRLVVALGDDFYADESMIAEAIAANESFNVIDQRTFLKVDVFVPRPGPLGEDQLIRRQAYTLLDGPALYVLGPEDTALQKLRWYQLTGETSDRQWRDIMGVLRVTRDVDAAYMRDVANRTGLSVLLERALLEATAH